MRIKSVDIVDIQRCAAGYSSSASQPRADAQTSQTAGVRCLANISSQQREG